MRPAGAPAPPLPATVNGVTTDWRVTRAVADLVRARNPSGKILVMEGSNQSTTTAYSLLGYTSANFGTSVDEFIALEGTSCTNHGTSYQTGLVQKPAISGKLYWVNQRYLDADVVISIGALKTHGEAGTTGCVKNLGIGATPNTQYSVSTSASDCTRNMTQSAVSSYIDHGRTGLGSVHSRLLQRASGRLRHHGWAAGPAEWAVLHQQRGPDEHAPHPGFQERSGARHDRGTGDGLRSHDRRSPHAARRRTVSAPPTWPRSAWSGTTGGRRSEAVRGSELGLRQLMRGSVGIPRDVQGQTVERSARGDVERLPVRPTESQVGDRDATVIEPSDVPLGENTRTTPWELDAQ